MKQEQNGQSQELTNNAKASEANEPAPGEQRQKADDKSKQDADEKLPEEKKGTSQNQGAKEIDEMVQGQKLEEKYRGGDTTDVDEFKEQ